MADTSDIPLPQQIPDDAAQSIRLAHQIVQSAPRDQNGNYLQPDQQILDADQIVKAYQDQTSPTHYQGNLLKVQKFHPIDLTPDQTNASPLTQLGKDISGGLHGAVTSFVNNVGLAPENLPHYLEVLGTLRDQKVDHPEDSFLGLGLGERLQKADQNAVIPKVDVDAIERAITVPTKYISNRVSNFANAILGNQSVADGEAPSFSDIDKAEQARQASAEQERNFQRGKTAADIGVALPAIGGTLIALTEGLKGAAGKIMSLRGSNVMTAAENTSVENPFEPWASAPNPEAAKKAFDLQQEILPNLPKELDDALQNNTDEIAKLVKASPEDRGTLQIVQNVRDQLKQNKQLIGQAVGALRDTITENDPKVFDTSEAINNLQGVLDRSKFSGGVNSSMSSQDIRSINQAIQILKNPTEAGEATSEFTTNDAAKFLDWVDDHLEAQGFWDGENKTTGNKALASVRKAVNEELGAMYPAYQNVKTDFHEFENAYEPIASQLNGTNAESFLANIYGANKAEKRQLLTNVLDMGNKTVESMKKLSTEAEAGSKAAGNAFQKQVQELVDKANQTSFPSAEDTLDEIANRSVANRLANATDIKQDTLRKLLDEAGNRGELVGKGMGSTLAGGAGGAIAGPVGLSAGIPGGYIGGFAGRAIAENAAKQRFRPETLFDLINESKQSSTGLSTMDLLRAIGKR